MMSELINECPQISELIYSDLVRDLKNPDLGREGMLTAVQVFKVITIKQMNGFSFEDLAFHLGDSKTYSAYCGFGIADNLPSDSTLQRDIKKIRPETLEACNQALLKLAVKKKIEKGRKVRIDCTVVKSNIHYPMDSALLYDCVRVLARITKRYNEAFKLNTRFVDHTRKAKKRSLKILNTRGKEKKKAPYIELIGTTEATVGYATNAMNALIVLAAGNINEAVEAAAELEHYISLAHQVIYQSTQRVVHNKRVLAADKVVSIFEPHTDIIRKDYRDTYYGHKVALTGGASGLFTDVVVEKGNPSDATLVEKMISRQEVIYKRVPRQAVFDGGFASKANLIQAKNMGVNDVAFAKKCGLKEKDMTKSPWVYKRLRNFRAGIEGMISFLKRCFGMRCCNWRGFESFKSYAWSSVITANLLLMARHLLA